MVEIIGTNVAVDIQRIDVIETFQSDLIQNITISRNKWIS